MLPWRAQMSRAGEAAGRHEYARAQHLLDLVKSLAQRGRVSRAAHIELAYQQARVYEGLGRYLEAMTEYQRLLATPEGQRGHDHAVIGGQPYLFSFVRSRAAGRVYYVVVETDLGQDGGHHGPPVRRTVADPVQLQALGHDLRH